MQYFRLFGQYHPCKQSRCCYFSESISYAWNTSYVQIRNEQASEQLIKVQFQVAISGRYRDGVNVNSIFLIMNRYNEILGITKI